MNMKAVLIYLILGFSSVAMADSGDHDGQSSGQQTETDYIVTDTLSTGDVFQAVFTGRNEGNYIDNVTLKSLSFDGQQLNMSNVTLGYYTSNNGALTQHTGSSGLHVSVSGYSQNNFYVAASDAQGEAFLMASAKGLLSSNQTYDLDDAKLYANNGHLVDNSYTITKNLSGYGIGNSTQYVEYDDTSNLQLAAATSLTVSTSLSSAIVNISSASALPEANILPLLGFGLLMPLARRRRRN